MPSTLSRKSSQASRRPPKVPSPCGSVRYSTRESASPTNSSSDATGVTIGHLLQMAPLYFALLAEGSLEWRRTELAELQAAINRVNELGNLGNKRFALHAWHAADDSHAEAEAIERGDIFNDPMPNDYEYDPGEDWDGSPFADYLRKLANDLGKPELVDLEPYSHGRVAALPGVPAYRICTEDLRKIAPLRSDAMYALHSGEAAIAEIPDHLMADDAAVDRRSWLEDRLSPESRQRLDRYQRVIAAIKVSRDDVTADAMVPEGDER